MEKQDGMWLVNKSSKKKNQPLFKFGVQVPRNAQEALDLDTKNGNTMWQDSIDLEFKGINVNRSKYIICNTSF